MLDGSILWLISQTLFHCHDPDISRNVYNTFESLYILQTRITFTEQIYIFQQDSSFLFWI